ncbi:ATP-dependent DNA ligase [Taibaiella soli]|uniref:DNA ligase (ATP) n=1 Tax=Taibaiella soli TaxID=1649169 RepID=A0A2W2AZX2_9BACT|nr:ATP-dependent DNA ligase [Taibaiella soli]PZF73258.1 ATP-dependent DNA ligase [Taibaiella soli]
MKGFSELFTVIEQTTKINAKIDALVQYFADAPESDIVWCVALLTGKTPRRAIKTADLRNWCAELSGLPMWLFDESYLVVGDLAETIALCLPAPVANKEYSLTETLQQLNKLAAASDEEKKRIITARWMEMNANNRLVFNKLITGGFRMGVSRQLVIKALAKHYNQEENQVAHKLMGNWNPEIISIDELLFEANSGEKLYHPYPFFLAYQVESELAVLGDVHDWQIEEKYDGIRGQIIVRNGELFIWSRGEELITDKFPEFELLKNILPNGTVLDGEILPYKDGRPLPFQIMQTRISRKNVTKKSLQEAPLVMICYDLLEQDGKDIRDMPLSSRRQQLEYLVTLAGSQAPLIISPVFPCNNWDEVIAIREAARDNNCEGVMLKKKDSVYETGRRRGNWWKWKVDPLTVDAVLIYAQRGHGRRADLYTDYTFAVWDNDVLVPFAKAYSGLTDKEILEVDNWIKKNTIEKFGPVRSVTPELVFELAFEGINESTRHKSGVAVRFPRIARWRKDKNIGDANTKFDLLQLIEAARR